MRKNGYVYRWIKMAALCAVAAVVALSASSCAAIKNFIGWEEAGRPDSVSFSKDSAELSHGEISEEAPDTPAELFTTEKAEGGLAVTAYTGEDGEVKIPAAIGGENVVLIKAGAFGDAKAADGKPELRISGIAVPPTVVGIEFGAFSKCRSLKNLQLPFAGGFADRYGYIGYVFGASDPSANGSFLPESLEKLKVGGKTVAEKAFYGCENLKTLVLTEAESVGKNAFQNCSSLKSLVLPDSVLSIGEGAFLGCRSIAELSLPFLGDGGENLFLGAVFGAGDYTQNLKYVPPSLRTLTLSCPDELPKGAFYECIRLVNLNLKCNLKKVGERAFYRCRRLKCLNVLCEDSAGISEVGPYAFGYCGALGSLSLSENLRELPEGAFYACSSLRTLRVGEAENVLPETQTSIGRAAFAYCENLAALKLPQSLKALEEKTFYGCSHLTEMTVPGSVKLIADEAFAGCSSLKDLTIETKSGRGVSSVGRGAFLYCTALRRLVLPECVGKIGDEAFAYSGIAELEISGGEVEIGAGVFSGCGSFVVDADLSSATYKNLVEAGLGSDNFRH